MSDIQLFSPEDCVITGDGSITDISTAENSAARIALVLESTGLHYCYETYTWRRYVAKTGMWKRINFELFKKYVSALHGREIGLNYNDAQPLTLKKLEEIKFKIGLISSIGDEWDPVKNVDLLPFENVVLDLKTKLAVKYHKELLIESQIDRKYSPEDGTDCPSWDHLIDHLSQGNPKVADVLEAFAFLSFAGRGELERCILMMYSELGGSGKGTFINALLSLAGKDRGMTSNLCRLNDETTVSYFENKTFVAFPDEREVMTTRSERFGKLLKFTSQDVVTGRMVYSSQLYAFRGNAMVVVASNIHIFPPDGGGNRRLLILKCFPPEKDAVDIHLLRKINKEISQITNKLLNKFDFDVEKAQNVLIDAVELDVFQKNFQENADETSNLAAFLRDMVIPCCPINKKPLKAKVYKNNEEYEDMPIAAVSIDSLYAGYKNYIADNNPGAKPIKKTKFERDISNFYAELPHEHILEWRSSHIPGLTGQKERIVGLMFNPLTWQGIYTSWAP